LPSGLRSSSVRTAIDKTRLHIRLAGRNRVAIEWPPVD